MIDGRPTGSALGWVQLPTARVRPLYAVLTRFALAFLLLALVVLIVYLGRDGYRDSAGGGPLSLLDAAYYATVTLTTTGYGDIVPVTPHARLVNTALITPLRLVFLVLLVGTTLQVLAQRTRQEIRLNRWRSRVHDHTIVIGYGTKGRSAIATLRDNGATDTGIVAVDGAKTMVREANEAGLVGVVGDATRTDVLRRAGIERARHVLVAVARDDTAVLVTLTARQLNPKASIVACVRESENEPLLAQSGADHVITTSETAGRLLGTAAVQPEAGSVVHDLLVHGTGQDLVERDVRPGEVGKASRDADDLVVAVIRGGRKLPYDDPRCTRLERHDRLVVVRSTHGAAED
ncbi:MAG TPA: potassium channel family protein [Streptosporangiaceae bacterium]